MTGLSDVTKKGLKARTAAHVAMLGEEDFGPPGLVNKPSLGGMLASEPAPEASEQLPMLPDIPGASPGLLGVLRNILEADCHMKFCSKIVSHSMVIKQKCPILPAASYDCKLEYPNCNVFFLKA